MEFLDSRIDYERFGVPYRERSFTLDRMTELLRRLGDPHLRLPAIHIAGTKGKGSTAAFVNSILVAAGFRTGLHTSPHLRSVDERIAIDGQPCGSESLRQLIDRVRPAVESQDRAARDVNGCPTYFEITSAMAMLHFAEQKVDAAILEVGLGGRLDSTNVCCPIVTAITSISFDHMVQLGHTLGEIAAEKAGIIKPDVPVVCGVTDSEPLEVIAATAARQQSPLDRIEVDFGYAYRPPSPGLRNAKAEPSEWTPPPPGAIEFWTAAGESAGRRATGPFAMGLRGAHQAANGAVALAIIDRLVRQGWDIPVAAQQQGLAAAVCPARVELDAGRPTLIFDAAHNGASVSALVDALRELDPPTPRTLVFATSRDKDAQAMLQQLLPEFQHVILTTYGSSPRCYPAEQLAELAREFQPASSLDVVVDAADAWRIARRSTPAHGLICVTGSFFIAAAARRDLREDEASAEAGIAVPGDGGGSG